MLLHGLGAGGLFQLDLIGPMTAHGPVVAPDLPGSILGQTDTPRPGAARVEVNARFVPRLLDTLGIDRVVLHGWSMGASVAMHTAAWFPDRIAAVVLANPPLPVPLRPWERMVVRLLGRPLLMLGSAAARGLVRVAGPRIIETKLGLLTASDTPSAYGGLGLDLDSIRADTLDVWIEQFTEVRHHPESLAHAVTAFASVISDIVVDQRRMWAVIDEIRQPVLLLWGDHDPLLERSTIEHVLERRPEWDLRTFPGSGHALPIQAPEHYANVVGAWLSADLAIMNPQP